MTFAKLPTYSLLDPVVDRSKIGQVESIEKSSTSDQVDRVESIFSLIKSIDLPTTNRVKIFFLNLHTCVPSLRNGQMAEMTDIVCPSFRPSVGLATFNCVSSVLSPGPISHSRRSQNDCACFHCIKWSESSEDSTTATHCCTVLPTHYSGGCSPYRTVLPAWSRVHGDRITLVRFWRTSIGCRFGVVSTVS